MTRSLAIMQPAFLPWMGYFALMDRVDEFVILDSVQFERRSWQQRNRVKGPNGVIWLTVPVRSHGRRDQRIDEVVLADAAGFARSAITTLDSFYSRVPHHEDLRPPIVDVIARSPERLVDLTIPLMTTLRDQLGITTPFIRSSDLEVSGHKTELLVEICRQRGATLYVSPPGSRAYLEGTTAFGDAGIELRYHQYEHPVYPQLWGEFVPYLSAVDVLFNLGPDALACVRRGVR